MQVCFSSGPSCTHASCCRGCCSWLMYFIHTLCGVFVEKSHNERKHTSRPHSHTHIRAHVRAYTYTTACRYTHAYKHACIHTRMHTHVHSHMRACVCTRTCTHQHAHAQKTHSQAWYSIPPANIVSARAQTTLIQRRIRATGTNLTAAGKYVRYHIG